MRMGGGDDIEVADPAGPQIRGDNILPGVEVGAARAAELEDSAAIDQHGLRIGEHNQETIALADVDGAELKGTGDKPRSGGMKQQNREQRERSRGREPQQRAMAAMPR